MFPYFQRYDSKSGAILGESSNPLELGNDAFRIVDENGVTLMTTRSLSDILAVDHICKSKNVSVVDAVLAYQSAALRNF